LAIAVQRRLSEFNQQDVANTAWAFATVKYRDEELFAALAIAADRRLSEFNPQEVANTAWAFATVNYRNEQPFAALATAAERRLSEFSLSSIQMALWASSRRECRLATWSRFSHFNSDICCSALLCGALLVDDENEHNG